jgi:hypothetical protein
LPTFEIIYRSKKVTVEEIHLRGGKYFFVSFENEWTLFITRDEDSQSWTSMPPGYQGVADEVGALINEHLLKEK